MVILTEELILSKSNAKSVSDVRNLNLWGCELDNVSALKKCASLEVLSLSVNNLTTLDQLAECESAFQFSDFNPLLTNLPSINVELYLRKNYINDAEQVKHLTPLRNLEVLWLCDNPCADDEKKYRYIILRYLPWLKKLDHHDVTDDEVLASMSSSPAAMPLKIRKRFTIPSRSPVDRSSSSSLDKNEEKSFNEFNGTSHLKATVNSGNLLFYGSGSFPSSPMSLSWSQPRTPRSNYDSEDQASIVHNEIQTTKDNTKSSLTVHENNQTGISNGISGIAVRSLVKTSGSLSRSPSLRSPSLTPPPSLSSNTEKLNAVTKSPSKIARQKSSSSLGTSVDGNLKTNGIKQVRLQVKPTTSLIRTPSRTSPSKVNDNNLGDIGMDTKNEPRQSNVLTAVLALIDELGEKDLQVVQRKIRLLTLNRQGQPSSK
ncbi:17703_t:CDS:2 [Cetraspora pellucida]|uniref:17703_t:CDS:1 n=2 Tax=Cetraspora pellucida TaxID=1433469 RepID=A0ACA9LIR2_9GLOM|nr:17703_t:CDS:2 [Cetraspora pellucida]